MANYVFLGGSSMSKKIVSVIFVIVSVIGAVVILNSVLWGRNAANSILSASGSMNTTKYLVFLEKSIFSYQLLGAVLFILGGLGFIKTMKSLFK